MFLVRFQKELFLYFFLSIIDDLMRSIQQVKEILRAKWTGGSVTPQGSAQPIQSHEELTHEAEAILNKANSKC